MMRSQIPLLVAALYFGMWTPLPAQESADSEGGAESIQRYRFFDRPIDFWGAGFSYEDERIGRDPEASTSSDAAPKPGPPSDWGFAVKLPDGRTAYRELPEPLVQVLEDPTPEKIQAYFKWRLERMAKILRATELMKQYRDSALVHSPELRSKAPRLGSSSSRPRKVNGAEGKRSIAQIPKKTPFFTLTYFHDKG